MKDKLPPIQGCFSLTPAEPFTVCRATQVQWVLVLNPHHDALGPPRPLFFLGWWCFVTLSHFDAPPKMSRSQSLESVCCLYVAKTDFADVLRILRWRSFPGVSGRALNVITRVFIRGRQGDVIQKTEEKRQLMETESERVETLLALKMEEQATSQQI